MCVAKYFYQQQDNILCLSQKDLAQTCIDFTLVSNSFTQARALVYSDQSSYSSMMTSSSEYSGHSGASWVLLHV